MRYNSYDRIPEHQSILLDLPFQEGIGTVTRDLSEPHHKDILLINTPTWETLASGLGVLAFDNTTNEYIELDHAACVDFDFIAGDYSLGCWFRWEDTATSLNVMGRYELDVSGWEVYLFGGLGGQNYLTSRHHHAGTLVPPIAGNPRSACYSENWSPLTWWFMGISRIGGGEAQHYRNGIAVEMTTGGLVDPETCAQDLVMGARWTKNADFFKGKRYRPRIWNRALSQKEWKGIFNAERAWFGV